MERFGLRVRNINLQDSPSSSHAACGERTSFLQVESIQDQRLLIRNHLHEASTFSTSFIKFSLCDRHNAECLTCIILFHPRNNYMKCLWYYFHFTDWEPETLKGQVTRRSSKWCYRGSDSGWSDFQVHNAKSSPFLCQGGEEWPSASLWDVGGKIIIITRAFKQLFLVRVIMSRSSFKIDQYKPEYQDVSGKWFNYLTLPFLRVTVRLPVPILFLLHIKNMKFCNMISSHALWASWERGAM